MKLGIVARCRFLSFYAPPYVGISSDFFENQELFKRWFSMPFHTSPRQFGVKMAHKKSLLSYSGSKLCTYFGSVQVG